ncbi:MAG TPA: RagB/SusD family nutrient uptake outer membrane protein [Bacteroidales bacterium]|nr:RagB/SusD family nutrient uptake outer membrane protein [Bacteroidales bacterium]
MKRNIKTISLFLMMVLFMVSCKDYLNIPQEADISEEQIFGTYASFQGFQDQLLNNLVDFNNHGARVTHSVGGEALSPSAQAVYNGNLGNYMYLLTNRGIYCAAESGKFSAGLYTSMWENMRICNICLEKLNSDLLKDATEEQKDWLKGQALFFRAYYNYEFVRSFGTMPYVDQVFTAEEQDMQRHWTYVKNGITYKDVQAVFERIVDDLDEAASLLPAVWPSPNINWGRPSKLTCLGYKAKALQFSASPLFNEQATGVADYNKDLLNRCALACKETIDLAVSLVGTQPAGMPEADADGLTKWADMRTAFATVDGTQPYTPEVLFHRTIDIFGAPIVSQSTARNYGVNQLTGQKAAQGSQNYLDKFEMKDGSRYQISYDNNKARRWDDRDNRYDFNFYMHGDKVDKITLDLSASKLSSDGAVNSNAVRKFLCDGVTKNNPGQAAFCTPLLRLADIYLTYAEAVFESTGSYNTVPAGLTMTAEEAVNKIRLRAGQPNVAATLPFYENNPLPGSCELDSDPAFRLLYRNERAVELAYEGVYWFDIRRWKRAKLQDGVQLQALTFDVDNKKAIIESTVKRVDVTAYVFKDQHYWMPFDPSLTRFTTEWEQNPGW